MEERGLVGLEARTPDGTEVGRISEVISDERSGAVTHVVLERGEERFEVPVEAIAVDRERDFATFHVDRADVAPGDREENEVEPERYAPSESSVDDREHEGQFVTTPQDPAEAVSPAEEESTEAAEASGWEDENSNPPDSGYPRNDAYIDADTGEEVVDPRVAENDDLQDEVDDLLADTGLSVRSVRDGIVELSGSASDKEELEGMVEEIMGMPDILEVDATDVEVG